MARCLPNSASNSSADPVTLRGVMRAWSSPSFTFAGITFTLTFSSTLATVISSVRSLSNGMSSTNMFSSLLSSCRFETLKLTIKRRRDGHPTEGMGVSRERCAPVPVCGSTKMERFPQISSVLEGNVVGYRGGGLRAALFAGNFSASFLSIVPRTEQDNVPRHNLRSIFLYAILSVFPGGCLQLAFNVELRSLADVLSHDLRQTLPSHNAVPFCFVLPLIVPVFESFVRGEADFSYMNSTGRVLDLPILAYVFHPNYLSHAFCPAILPFFLCVSTRAAPF